MTDSTKKIGRNDPCSCNSGKKFKRCHGSAASSGTAPKAAPRFEIKKLEANEVPVEVQRRFAEAMRESQEYTQQFGHVRPLISQEHKGHRFVVVGNQLVYSPAERTQFFTDFLITLLNQFGREWWEAELAKPCDQRHPIFQLRTKALEFMYKQPKSPEGVYAARMTGPMLAYFTFAYDMFVVMDNGRLDARLLGRLKHPEQFQGARHELFAEATCLRAGFTIEHEDESDGSTRHAEFAAVHKATGEKVSVEAKSKHRPGVLGQPGTREAPGTHKLPIGRLLNDAIAKNVQHPLVVFLEMNLPWQSAQRLLAVQPPHPLIHRTIDRMRVGYLKLDPISQLVVTNHPEHYTADEEAATSPQLLSVIATRPLKPMKRADALRDIHTAASMYGNIPQNFPKK
jgi:SEC-C motif